MLSKVNNWEREWVHGTAMTRARWVKDNILNGVVFQYLGSGARNLWYGTKQQSLGKIQWDNGFVVIGEP